MFEDKTLVALGCSHTYGVYEQDLGSSPESINSCFERSWASKLSKLGNFKEVVNLSIPGGNNNRSERVLLNYLKKNSEKLIVIFTITELSRFETVNILSHTSDTITEIHDNYGYQTEGIWKVSEEAVDIKRRKFLEHYYVAMNHDVADTEAINRRVLLISTLLNSLKIEHYFIEMICKPDTIEQQQLGFKIPTISFQSKFGYNINAMNWMIEHFKPGTCGHFDHDANQALADYIYKRISDE